MKRKFPAIQVLAVFITLAVQIAFNTVVMAASESQYQVLSPWAEVDPMPLRGISPRLDSLAGKKIGLFANYKRAGVPIVEEVGLRLKERYPDIQVSLYHARAPNVIERDTENKAEYEAWLKGVDAVVTAVGD